MLARGTAEEERGSSFGGRGLGADPAVSSVATNGGEAAARARGVGTRSVSAARQRG